MNTAAFISGLIILVATIAVFWRCLPKDGKTHRLTDTEWEPYVGVAFCSAFALSFTLILSSVLDYLG
ncbi:MAG: hypothetical protein WCI56_14990 [Hyphomicrobiales bacterium]